MRSDAIRTSIARHCVAAIAISLVIVAVAALSGVAEAQGASRRPEATTGGSSLASASSLASIRRIRSANGMALVRTESSKGIGLATVPESVFAGLQEDVKVTDDDLKTLETLSKSHWDKDVIRLGAPMLLKDPKHVRVRRLLALAFRREWSFVASSTLLEELCKENEEAAKADKAITIDLDLMREAAEVAALRGEKRVWEPAIRRYRRHARAVRDKGHEARCDAIERHAQGEILSVFADGPPPHRDAAELTKSRAENDGKASNYLVGTDTAQRLTSFLSTRDGLAQSATVRLNPQDKQSAERYLSGGSEAVFRGRIRTATANVLVNRQTWLMLWDHEKHEEMTGLVYILRERFPAADCTVSIYVRGVGDGGAQNEMAAIVRMAYNKSPVNELFSERRWDPRRDEAMQREQTDAEDQRKGRVR